MKHTTLLFLSICVALSSLGQQKKFITKDVGSKNYPFAVNDSVYKDHLFKYHYRFSNRVQIVDLWSNDGVIYHGSFKTFVYEVNEKGIHGNILLREEIVDSAKCAQIVKTYDELAINTIPRQGEIPGWEPMKGGDILYLGVLSPKGFFGREYWEPSGQRAEQLKIVNKFYMFLKTTLDMSKKAIAFDSALSIGNYTDGQFYYKKKQGQRTMRDGYYLFN